MLGVSCLVVGCTAETRYSVLTFFFDGVPPPEGTVQAPDTGQDSGWGTPPVLPPEPAFKGSTHKPYAERRCEACHNVASDMSLLEPMGLLCRRCHANFGRQYRWVHGPAAVAECGQCHQAHSSPHENLVGLRLDPKVDEYITGDDLCLRCHWRSDVIREGHPDPPDKACLDCHSPHGGRTRELLREEAADAGES